MWVVVLSSLLAIVETEPVVENIAPRAFAHIEQIFTVLFLMEYLIRLWAEGENPKFGGIRGRIRYALTPAAIIDLAAFLPSLVAPGISSPMLLRSFRLLRILRLARLGRFSLAMRNLTEAVTERREELLLSLMRPAGISTAFRASRLRLEAAVIKLIAMISPPDAHG